MDRFSPLRAMLVGMRVSSRPRRIIIDKGEFVDMFADRTRLAEQVLIERDGSQSGNVCPVE